MQRKDEVLDHLRQEESEALLRHLEARAVEALKRGRRIAVRDHAMVGVALAGGLRASEVVTLRVQDVVLSGEGAALEVRRPRGDVRTVVMPGAIARTLRSYLAWLPTAGWSTAGEAPLFPGRGGRTITRNGAWRVWARTLRAAQLEHRPLMAARHTAGRMLYRVTGNLHVVQRHLGHARVNTVAMYAETAEDDLARGLDLAWGA